MCCHRILKTSLLLEVAVWLFPGSLTAQVADSAYLRLDAAGHDPLYTTYAASLERSRLYGDKAYKMDYSSGCGPVSYSSDQSGKIYGVWKIDQVVVTGIREYFQPPVVKYSFPDMAILEYSPFRGVQVQETFLVYSSQIALVDMVATNTDNIPHQVDLYPVYELGNDSLEIDSYQKVPGGYLSRRYESPYRLISSLKMQYPYPTHLRDLFVTADPSLSYGGYKGSLPEFYNYIKTDFYSENRTDSLNMKESGYVNFEALHLKSKLNPGEYVNFRFFRGVLSPDDSLAKVVAEIDNLKHISLGSFRRQDVTLFSRVPGISFRSKEEKDIYLGAFNLARGCMYPPSGKTSNNFYVFSREPLWGWGHGHQVLHESLSMLAYAYLDPVSAMGSQRVYMEQQREDGLIAYRHGPRGLQDYPHKGMSTTSAPFYSWINLEVYGVSKDKKFLEDAYSSGTRYLDWIIRNRDTDQDGTYEWGPYGIIENVRDWYNAVFQVSKERHLDVDKEDISDELECLDLTLMVIHEARCLSVMAGMLGKDSEAMKWKSFADTTSLLVNERMWDDSTGFYYSVNKVDHSFRYLTRNLKRQEIIAFLALWANAAPPDRAGKLIQALTDTNRFWRRYGIPTLSAEDEWYSPYVDYCCKWNGPVWLLWNYMVYEGLRQYGFDQQAHALAGKMELAVTTQLRKNHNYWESYSPDNEVLNCPPNYIWDCIMAKVLIQEYRPSPPWFVPGK